MPGIVLFSRRWNIASDDFFYPGIIELMCRTVWLTPTLAYYIKYQPSFSCNESLLLHIYYIGYLAIMGSILLTQIFIVAISSRGTIMFPHPRRHMDKFVYVRLSLVALEIIWNVVGIVWMCKTEWSECSDLIFVSVLVNIVFCFVAVITLVIVLFFLLDPISHLPEGDTHKKRDILYNRIKNLFFCCYCCLYSSGGNSRSIHYENSYRQISSMLEMVFRGGNLTPSDVLAGIILLNIKEVDQYKREIKLHKKTNEKRRMEHVLRLNEIMPWMNINEASYYIRYAVATYSWPYYVYMNNVRGIKELFCYSSGKARGCCCCDCCQSDDSERDMANEAAMSVGQQLNNQIPVIQMTIHGDTRSKRYFRAFKFLSKINDCDLIYANFQNELFLVPFCVVVDHTKKNIVITIRGTLSIRDALTDLTAEVEYVYVDDQFKNQPFHKGIYNTSENIYNKLKSMNLLEEAFKAYPDYELMVTGHSLGAGTALLLSLKLRKEYPSLKCIAYSPPGAMVSPALADHMRSFVMCVIVGDDIVPRLSIRAIHDLKADILRELYACPFPKYKVIWKYSLSFLSKKPQFFMPIDASDDESEENDDNDSLNDSIAQDEYNNSFNSTNSRKQLLNKADTSRKEIATVSSRHPMPSTPPPILQIDDIFVLSSSDENGNDKTKVEQPQQQDQPSTSVVSGLTEAVGQAVNEISNSRKQSKTSVDSNKSKSLQAGLAQVDFMAIQQEVNRMIADVYSTYPELCIPGNILYIHRIHTGKEPGHCVEFCLRTFSCCFSQAAKKLSCDFDYRWADREEFKKILITNRTLIDHFPNSVEEALRYFSSTSNTNNIV